MLGSRGQQKDEDDVIADAIQDQMITDTDDDDDENWKKVYFTHSTPTVDVPPPKLHEITLKSKQFFPQRSSPLIIFDEVVSDVTELIYYLN